MRTRVSAIKTNLNLKIYRKWTIEYIHYVLEWCEVTHKIQYNNNSSSIMLGKLKFFVAQETVKIKVWTNKHANCNNFTSCNQSNNKSAWTDRIPCEGNVTEQRDDHHPILTIVYLGIYINDGKLTVKRLTIVW